MAPCLEYDMTGSEIDFSQHQATPYPAAICVFSVPLKLVSVDKPQHHWDVDIVQETCNTSGAEVSNT
jgi:hypothetical protein